MPQWLCLCQDPSIVRRTEVGGPLDHDHGEDLFTHRLPDNHGEWDLFFKFMVCSPRRSYALGSFTMRYGAELPRSSRNGPQHRDTDPRIHKPRLPVVTAISLRILINSTLAGWRSLQPPTSQVLSKSHTPSTKSLPPMTRATEALRHPPFLRVADSGPRSHATSTDALPPGLSGLAYLHSRGVVHGSGESHRDPTSDHNLTTSTARCTSFSCFPMRPIDRT